MYTLTIKLKQHTPLIHFQHEQAGATLRATEVKPKLDRFLVEKFGGKENHPEWFASDKHDALDYKVRVEAKGDSKKYFITSNPKSERNDGTRILTVQKEFSTDVEYVNQTQYFANNKNLKNTQVVDKEEVKLGVLHAEVEILLHIWSKGLYDFLNRNDKEVLKVFFILNSFGTRSTKGFGCFLPKDFSNDLIKKCFDYDSNLLGVFEKKSSGDVISQLQSVAAHYALLKRGKSYNGYEKAKLWTYLCNTRQLTWEKRVIKLHLKKHGNPAFLNLETKNKPHKIDFCKTEDNDNSMYIRALLGLAEQFEFKNSDNTKLIVKVKDNAPEKHRIDRFKSPIRYLVTNTHLYIFAYKINHLLYSYSDDNGNTISRKFTFEVPNTPRFELGVPNSFDLLDFLKKHSGYTPIPPQP